MDSQVEKEVDEGAFYKALDVHSKSLRDMANDLVLYLSSIPNPPEEIKSMSLAASHISNMEIEKLDEVLTELKNAIDAASAKIKNPEFIKSISEEKIPEIYNKQNGISIAAAQLIKKADELFNQASAQL